MCFFRKSYHLHRSQRQSLLFFKENHKTKKKCNGYFSGGGCQRLSSHGIEFPEKVRLTKSSIFTFFIKFNSLRGRPFTRVPLKSHFLFFHFCDFLWKTIGTVVEFYVNCMFLKKNTKSFTFHCRPKILFTKTWCGHGNNGFSGRH